MTKGEIIYHTAIIGLFGFALLMNIEGAIEENHWVAFLQGASVLACVEAIIFHVAVLIKGKVKSDETKDVSHT